ncbi:hypothetical protein E4T48_07787 [Aureobasidium sp. EXF-10727]|nr:hypothetical protein E4T48_07787 [Aureobasidium sp. EXF-10727]
MLRPSSARDATTCLRCNLRLVLRQLQQRRYQSSHESPSTSAPSPQTPRLRIIRSHGNHGRVRGKKGGQRRVESSEALSIDSLGQSSEVIVLRDLHEPRPEEKKPDEHTQQPTHVEASEHKPPALTGRDIENMSGRRAIRPDFQEVFESIDALRPEEGVHIFTQDEFRRQIYALRNGYTISQLRGYLLHKTAPASTAKGSRRASRASRKTASTEISSQSGPLQNLKRTAWHPGTTPIAKRLPVADLSMHLGRRMDNKDDVIEAILRQVWTLGIEEEQTAIGEMEFLLSPMQFGLLLTKNSDTLRPLLESTKFYKNSRFQLHQADHVIRIVGPRTESEAIANVLTEAFIPARSADIDLKTFRAALEETTSPLTLRDILTPAQLNNIMGLTRTYVHYDANAERLRIASFVEVAINDAHRLLIALLPSRPPVRVTHLYDSHKNGNCRLDPISANKDLPSHVKNRQLGRWVTSSPRSKQFTADQTFLDAENDNPFANGASDRELPKLHSGSPIIREAVAHMNANLVASSEDTSKIDSDIWPQKAWFAPWKANIGLSLHDIQKEDTYPGAAGIFSSIEEPATYPKQVFASKLQGLVSLLSSVPQKKPWQMVSDGGFMLTAHLIPSPLEQTGILASTTFPTVQLRFYVTESTALSHDQMRISAMLSGGKCISFKDMRAVLGTEAIQLNLPSHNADIRFERDLDLLSRRATRDPNIKSFVEAVFESMANDATLRAPPALQIPIPQAIVRIMSKSCSNKPQYADSNLETHAESWEANRSILVKYLFAGFEYREPRNFNLGALGSGYRATLHTIEAGVTGGRRLALSLRYFDEREQHPVEDSATVEGLANASVNVINVLATSPSKKFDSRNFNSKKSDPTDRSDSRRFQSNASTSSRSSREKALAGNSLRNDRSKEPPKLAPSIEAFTSTQAKLDAREQAPQAQVIDDSNALAMEKVAKQERLAELEKKQDPRVGEVALNEAAMQETITIEKPESQTRAFDAPEEQDRTEQISDKEPPLSTPSTSQADVSQQTINEAAAEPETQVVNTGEAKASEDEPLSVRLKRMMGGL